LIIGFLILMEVQTPTVFSAEKIDFGKIEKWEDNECLFDL
jgi:hypothetical protein